MSGKAESFFRKFGKKVDELYSDVEKSELMKKLELKERLAELQKDKVNLENNFNNFKEENQQTFDDIRSSLEESFDEIKKSFKRFKNKSTS